MSGLLDKQVIEIPCSECSRKTEKRIGWIKSNKQFVCSCGASVSINAGEFKAEIAKVERAIKRLGDILKK